MKPRFFISGPMSGYPHMNYPTFHDAMVVLSDKRPDIKFVSPTSVYSGLRSHDENYYRREALKLLLSCSGLVRLPRWDESQGARLESIIAIFLGMRVNFLEDFIPDYEECDRIVNATWKADLVKERYPTMPS